jgi:hypothetical protein
VILGARRLVGVRRSNRWVLTTPVKPTCVNSEINGDTSRH